MKLKYVAAAATLCSATMLAVPASAMPVDNLAGAMSGNAEQVRWVCGPVRCWWRPNFYGYGPRFYGSRGRAYGSYGRFRRW
jgi:hypothetical protein